MFRWSLSREVYLLFCFFNKKVKGKRLLGLMQVNAFKRISLLAQSSHFLDLVSMDLNFFLLIGLGPGFSLKLSQLLSLSETTLVQTSLFLAIVAFLEHSGCSISHQFSVSLIIYWGGESPLPDLSKVGVLCTMYNLYFFSITWKKMLYTLWYLLIEKFLIYGFFIYGVCICKLWSPLSNIDNTLCCLVR